MGVNEPYNLRQWRSRYASLLTLFPHEFRQEYAPLSLQLFTDIIRETYQETPDQVGGVVGKIFLETVVDIVREQAKSIKNHLLGNKPPMKNQDPFYIKHRLGLGIAAGAIIILGLGSVLSGVWGYNGPIAYTKRVIQTGMTSERIASSTNFGQEDVTASFVNDFIQTTYYSSGRTDVGYKSVHADPDYTTTSSGTALKGGLANTIHAKYTSMQSGFDPLTCSMEGPKSVRFMPGAYAENGHASVVALFTYANSAAPNRVTYGLRLDQSRSKNGEWLVASVTCTSLEEQDVKPYTTASGTSGEYNHRNDHTYSTDIR